nr:PAC2 family protein [Candidatus Sigynarchaeota archaeon]
PVNEMEDGSVDVFYAAEPEIVERLKAVGDAIKPLPKGMIYGIEAYVLNEALERDLDGFMLIVPVREYIPATRSAAALIDALKNVFNFLKIDTKDLLEQDKAIQSKLQELAEQIRRSQEPDQYIAPPPSKNTHSLFT